MTAQKPEALGLIVELFDQSMQRSTLLASRTAKRNDEYRDTLATQASRVEEVGARLQDLASSSATRPDERAIVFSLLATLDAVSKQALPMAARMTVYDQYRNAVHQLSSIYMVTPPLLPSGFHTYIARQPSWRGENFQSSGPLAGEHNTIIQRFLKGETLAAIAADYAVSPQAIQQLLTRQGVTVADREAILNDRLRELVEQGMSVADIAREVNLTGPTVRNRLKALGITASTPRPHKQIPPETAAEILRLRAGGAKLREIAEKVGVHTSTVHRVVSQTHPSSERVTASEYSAQKLG